MTAPRRAIRPEGPSTRVVVAVIIAGLLALGGGAAWLLSPARDGNVASPSPGSPQSAGSTTEPTGDNPANPPEENAGPAAGDPSADAAPTAASDPNAARQALEDCRARVARVQTVIDAASVGIDHWRRHVQAQTDRLEGRIDETRMRAEFSETKLAGPDDIRRYDAAIAANTGDANACADPAAVPADLAGQFDSCRSRAEVLDGSLRQADITMNDWRKHLADMQRSAAGHVPHAQDVWLETWRNAPPNLEAWAAAQRSIVAAPAC